MGAALRKPMTLAEFLAWEEGQELRWEFDGFEPVAAQRSRSGATSWEQDAIAAMVFVRKDNDLVADTLTAGDTLRMSEIDVEVPMAEFYAGLEFPPEGTCGA